LTAKNKKGLKKFNPFLFLVYSVCNYRKLVFLKPGDILFFDEFNVPLHEFKAFKEFTEKFYVKLLPISQVNTFYQVAFMVV